MVSELGQAFGRIEPMRMQADQSKASGADVAEKKPGAGNREQRRKGKIRRQEREFLPAALEILETPANPIGRAISLCIIAMFALAIAWACLGKIDIVAVAPGRLMPVGGVKLVQPRDMGSVHAIYVTDGQHVEAGELLIELESTESEVDTGQVIRARAEASIEASRLTAFIHTVKGEPAIFAPEEEGLDDVIIGLNRSRLDSDLAAYQAKLAVMKAEISRRNAEISAVSAEVAKLTDITPLLAEREATLKGLMEQGYSAKPVWQQAQAQLIDSRRELEAKRHRLAEAESSREATEKQLNGMIADTLHEAYANLATARKTFAQADLALRKARQRGKLQKLRAPVAGTVQQLAVHTVGGVVKAAEPVLVIVPDDARLEARAQLLNKDKGAVFEGQEVQVKFEAFDFTQYGTLPGEVVSVSNDAVESDRFGLVYDTRVSLAARTIRADGKSLSLTPGMAVTVEIKTGRRRVIDFLLSPLVRYRDEAIRER